MPSPEIIFVYDFKKEEKKIDDFLKNKEYVSIRSDRESGLNFCPHNLRCPKNKAKRFIKKFISRGYAAILQNYVPIMRDRFSGNILILKNYILMELMEEGPLTWLTREGKVEEQIKIRKSDLKEVEHFGKRLVKKRELVNILKLIKKVPDYIIIEFTLRPEGLYFWQIREDKTAKKLE